MEDESKPMCRAGCGYHADPATDGLCSLCFNKKTTLAPNCQSRHTAKSYSSPSSCLSRGQYESNVAVALLEDERHELLDVTPSTPSSLQLSSSPTTTPAHSTPSPYATPYPTKSLPNIKKNYVVDLQINLKSNQTQIQSVGTAAVVAAAAAAAGGSGDGADSLLKIVADKRAKRCAAKNCRRKLSLTDFQCRCGRCFCPLHRYSDRHDCTFNYREWGASEIQRKNPRVVGEKIRKI